VRLSFLHSCFLGLRRGGEKKKKRHLILLRKAKDHFRAFSVLHAREGETTRVSVGALGKGRCAPSFIWIPRGGEEVARLGTKGKKGKGEAASSLLRFGKKKKGRGKSVRSERYERREKLRTRIRLWFCYLLDPTKRTGAFYPVIERRKEEKEPADPASPRHREKGESPNLA